MSSPPLLAQSHNDHTSENGTDKLCDFRSLAMNFRGFGADRHRLKLRLMGDGDLWSLFLHHREECSDEFWQEVENRKAAGILSQGSPFWHLNTALEQRHARRRLAKSSVVELTLEEWEARKRRKMFRVISA
jgi:hypothetical protein